MAKDTKDSSERGFAMLLLRTASTKGIKEGLTAVFHYETVREIRASWHQIRNRRFSTAFENTEVSNAIVSQ